MVKQRVHYKIIYISHNLLQKSQPTYPGNLISIKPTGPPTTSVSPFFSLLSSLNSLIVSFVIPPLVSGILCLLISDLSHTSYLHLPHTYHISLLFHSLSSRYLEINSSCLKNHLFSLFYLYLPHPYHISLLFHSLTSRYLEINSSLALKLTSSRIFTHLILSLT